MRSPRERRSRSGNCATAAAPRNFCRTATHRERRFHPASWTWDTRTTNTHFLSKHQSGDDVTGSHGEIFGQIHGAALIVGQHLKTVASRCFYFLPTSPIHVRGCSSCLRSPFSAGAPVSLSHRAATPCNSAAGRCGRGGGGPSTPRCSPPGRWCARRRTRCQLTKGQERS